MTREGDPLTKRFKLGAAIAATAAVLGSAPYASAETGQTHPQPVVTHVKIAAPFDFAVGEAPENITVKRDHSVTVSMLGAPAGCRRPPRTIPGWSWTLRASRSRTQRS
ncbi:hypothetical protein [Streptomyces sp. NPDC093598]|uniref:hypothetical protein n=1 Tax=Streptomyces sp. NPDC093598 TaxID=3366046 RepID=UPI0037FADA09